MVHYEIVLTRAHDTESGAHSKNSLRTDALNALHEIPLIHSVEVVEESNDSVTLSYRYEGDTSLCIYRTILLRHGLRCPE